MCSTALSAEAICCGRAKFFLSGSGSIPTPRKRMLDPSERLHPSLQERQDHAGRMTRLLEATKGMQALMMRRNG